MEKNKSLMKRLTAVSTALIILMAMQVQVAMADSAPVPDQVALSWTASPQTTQTVAWRSTAANGKVQYMKDSQKTADFSGSLEKTASASALDATHNHFEAELSNLEPGTTYVYRVGNESSWSKAASFKTEAAATDSFSFMDLGDVQNGEDGVPLKKLLSQALTGYPDIKFALGNGDLIDEPENTKEWEVFYNAAEGVFDHIPLMTSIGNHEEKKPSYFKSMALPQNGPDGYKEQFYSFDYGNAHFVVLNSNIMGNTTESQPLIDWLKNDLQKSSKKWKFAVFHHPPYGATTGNADDEAKAAMMKEKWLPVLEENSVDMVFVGHQHMYMRTYPMKDGKVQEKQTDGITYVLGNSSNSKYYVNSESHDYIQKVISGQKDGTNIYSMIKINGNVLTLTSMGSDGSVKDTFVINKGKTLDSRVGVSSVKLLNNSFKPLASASAGGSCRMQAHLENHSSQPQNVLALIQIRGGNGATAAGGGKVLGIVSVNADVAMDGADVYADFTLPKNSAGTVFTDVYVLDEGYVPIDTPYRQFSFTVTAN